MFEVIPADVYELTDVDLRTLIAKLCEAELISAGLGTSGVTWGGNHTAADGGLDVKVDSAGTADKLDFIARCFSGFQVKKPDMPPAAITDEMRPNGTLRPIFTEIANAHGAYIIASSKASVSASTLKRRIAAMRSAVSTLEGSTNIHLDFYDRTRIASWTNKHPSIVVWLQQRIGKALAGWQPFGEWSASPDKKPYLNDEKIKIQRSNSTQSFANNNDGINNIRDELRKPGASVRLVGLSGVGKTRLAQALFEEDIADNALPKMQAIYTDLSEAPQPSPQTLLTNLISKRQNSILIIDNCPPDIHSDLARQCQLAQSDIKIITIEYDIQDNLTENTEAFIISTSSDELIEKLIKRRFPKISRANARSIAEFSGGNARIALAIANASPEIGNIGSLTDSQLFTRIFHQRNDKDQRLLYAAQALSLVYSFEVESDSGISSEISTLSALISQTPEELYLYSCEILRRELAQQRGNWRAILPHAIANRLAALALENIPKAMMITTLLNSEDRIGSSFIRRLSYLHNSTVAQSIAESWMNRWAKRSDKWQEREIAKLGYLSSTHPRHAINIISEAVNSETEKTADDLPQGLLKILRKLAYSKEDFYLGAKTIVQILKKKETIDNNERKVFTSLFTIALSGTNSTLDERLKFIKEMLESGDEKEIDLAMAALDKAFQSNHFVSDLESDFGSHYRDHGYMPETLQDWDTWSTECLKLIQQNFLSFPLLQITLRKILISNIYNIHHSQLEDENLIRTIKIFSNGSFWSEGWFAVRQLLGRLREQDNPPDISNLETLEKELSPKNLKEEIAASVDPEHYHTYCYENHFTAEDHKEMLTYWTNRQIHYGEILSSDLNMLTELLPSINRPSSNLYYLGFSIGKKSAFPEKTWHLLIDSAKDHGLENISALRGFLAGLSQIDTKKSSELLESVLNDSSACTLLPTLETCKPMDNESLKRLIEGLKQGKVPIEAYQILGITPFFEQHNSKLFIELLNLVADKRNNPNLAIEILYIHTNPDTLDQQNAIPTLAILSILENYDFSSSNQNIAYRIAKIIDRILDQQRHTDSIIKITKNLKSAIDSYKTYAFANTKILKSLLKAASEAVLDTLFPRGCSNFQYKTLIFDRVGQKNPINSVPFEKLIAWCKDDPANRYRILASLIDLTSIDEVQIVYSEKTDPTWNPDAFRLLEESENPNEILDIYADRFRPRRWSGSRGVLMLQSAKLLIQMAEVSAAELTQHIRHLAMHLRKEAELEIAAEEQTYKIRNERFE